uniref:Adenylyltransferase and sulfurtransferase MOCS3 (Trinotate prediction) n=1 Tax=Henneguya salminicola TaxID=69463 RepID=A0A6G3MGX3_HENSL
MMELLVQVIFKYLIIVVGIIGSMQALEALKISLQLDGVMSKRMLLFDGLTFRTRTIALRSKQTDCYSCSRHFNISELSFQPTACERQYSNISLINSISVHKYLKFLTEKTPHVLIDVRVHPQYNTAQFEHSISLLLIFI